MILQTGTISKDFQRWYKSYIRYMNHQETKKNTFLVYERILEDFGKFLKKSEDVKVIKDVKQDTILSFLEELEERHLEKKKGNKRYSAKTKGLYVAILKSFFEHIGNKCDPDEHGVVYSFEREFKGLAPKKLNKKRKIKYLNDDEIMNIIDYVNLSMEEGTHYDYIHSLAIKLMIFAGLRVTEMLNLLLKEVYTSNITNSKGEKDFYEIYLGETKSGEDQISLIKKEYIEKEIAYFSSVAGEDDYIFKGLGAEQRIDRSNMYKMTRKVYEKAGIKRKGLHILRHTAAVTLHRKTSNIVIVKELLRHSSLDTTMIYVKVEQRDLANGLR